MFFEKCPVFILERFDPVMFALVGNVSRTAGTTDSLTENAP
jgi:hypothetical protein